MYVCIYTHTHTHTTFYTPVQEKLNEPEAALLPFALVGVEAKHLGAPAKQHIFLLLPCLDMHQLPLGSLDAPVNLCCLAHCCHWR
jgi:hypothetical protein